MKYKNNPNYLKNESSLKWAVLVAQWAAKRLPTREAHSLNPIGKFFVLVAKKRQ